RLRLRQVDREGRPAADLALDRDPATALLDDPPRAREAEAGACTGVLRREERLEDMRPRLGVHADARVADGEDDVQAGLERARAGLDRRGELDAPRLDDELSTLWHRVARVQGEVHDHLLELAAVALV